MHINVQDTDSLTYDGSAALEEIICVAMALNISIRPGLKRFGDRGEKAATKELTQLHKKHTYDPTDTNNLATKKVWICWTLLCYLLRSAMEISRHKRVMVVADR